MSKRVKLLCIAALACIGCYGQVNNLYNLMPVPYELAANNKRFPVTSTFSMAIQGKPASRMYAEASRFLRRLSNATGIFLDKQGFVTKADSNRNASLFIRINRPGKLVVGEDERYTINITDNKIELNATTDVGGIRALETLLQLVSADENGYYFPGVLINDKPRFAWRGLLLDVALHFMPVEVVKRNLDGMAAAKMNVLHLHLCNDQGFRVESKTFPRLQQVASDGLFYTQEQIRDIIAYADQRGIRIVPEFVVPAHTTAILTAYPEFASIQRKYELQRYFGVFDPVLDPTNEKVYPFLKKLFGEMASLFPDQYFHIGGDENTGKDWQANLSISAFMHSHGMKNYMDLQTWFNKRLLPIVRSTGKTMMGWDEILQPGLPKDIVVQSWRGNEPYYRSVKQGYKAILSFGYYIDLIQPASYHYQVDPAPDSAAFTIAEKKQVLGGEATMWSELVTPLTVDSRIWPRTAAIAERLWSPVTVQNVNDMYRRLTVMSRNLERLGLQHELYKQLLLRQMGNGSDTKPLEILASVVEPLKIYERNQGDTLYTVFSPFTKLADLATPDQEEPRIFNKLVNDFLQQPTENGKALILDKLNLWAHNNDAFKLLLRSAPVLDEAKELSENLSLLAFAGIEAIQFLSTKQQPTQDWLNQQSVLIANARMQGARCELQIVDAIEKLIKQAVGS